MCNQVLILLIFSSLFSHAYSDTGMTETEIEKWFNEDNILPVQVDEGELLFLSEATEKPVLHSRSELTIDQHSINSGWTTISQCYRYLDPVARTEIVYQYQSIKNFHILSKQNIQSAKIKKNSIVLENVLLNAQLCIRADVQIFNRQSNNTFSLKSGPYHRKFLDGYFPYHVTLIIHYPEKKLKIITTNPPKQPGFQVKSEVNKVIFDSVFSGKLNIEAIFEQR